MQNLSGYRTIISVVVGLVLKLLAAKGMLHGDQIGLQDAIVDTVFLCLSFVADGFTIYFRMKAEKPGALADPEAIKQAAIELVTKHQDEAQKVANELAELLKEHDRINQKLIQMGQVKNAENK